MSSASLYAPRLPADDALRHVVHNEVHTRPTALIEMPARVLYIAVLNRGVDKAQELAHLQALPGHAGLTLRDLDTSFARFTVADPADPARTVTLQWERHTEFTRYAVLVPLPEASEEDCIPAPAPADAAPLPPDWIAGIPGATFAAIDLWMWHDELVPEHKAARMTEARRWFARMHGDDGRKVRLFGSQMGNGHSWGLSDFRIGADGFERLLVLAPSDTSDERAGRIAQRLLELETYRLMALRGLPTAKKLASFLAQSEHELVQITGLMEEGRQISEQVLMDRLTALAGAVERATAEHDWRYSASRAYFALVHARMDELREKPITGTQTMRDFIQRRTSPAMATVAASERRLATLAERIGRASALLRTRIDIAAEQQNRELLEQLTKGQTLQLSLQSTVEGLSIAAISYYMVSLVLYAGKAAKDLGWLPVAPELVAGLSIPLILFGVWWITRRIHDRLHHALGEH